MRVPWGHYPFCAQGTLINSSQYSQGLLAWPQSCQTCSCVPTQSKSKQSGPRILPVLWDFCNSVMLKCSSAEVTGRCRGYGRVARAYITFWVCFLCVLFGCMCCRSVHVHAGTCMGRLTERVQSRSLLLLTLFVEHRHFINLRLLFQLG